MVRLGNFLFHYRNGLFPLAFLLLFCPSPQLFASDWLAAGLGFAVAMTGQVIRAATIGLAYIIRGGRHRQVYAENLVTDGLFSHCRNPLYVGNYLVILGLGLAANSWVFVLAGYPFFFIAYWAIIRAEENFLRGKFGAAYDAYCAKVNRVLPRLSGLGETMGSMEFKWGRLVVKEYGSTFAWMLGMTAVVAWNLWQRSREASRAAAFPALAGVAGLLVAGYLVARYLKKSRRLRSD